MHIPTKRLGESQLTTLNETWIRTEDWAESVADTVEAYSKKTWRWMQLRPAVMRWSTVFLGVFISTVIGMSLHNDVTASSQLLLMLPAVLISALYSGCLLY